ncbi:hypothetical protein JCM8547_003093 [Rhodosporidiobolus lusitaniae]
MAPSPQLPSLHFDPFKLPVLLDQKLVEDVLAPSCRRPFSEADVSSTPIVWTWALECLYGRIDSAVWPLLVEDEHADWACFNKCREILSGQAGSAGGEQLENETSEVYEALVLRLEERFRRILTLQHGKARWCAYMAKERPNIEPDSFLRIASLVDAALPPSYGGVQPPPLY